MYLILEYCGHIIIHKAFDTLILYLSLRPLESVQNFVSSFYIIHPFYLISTSYTAAAFPLVWPQYAFAWPRARGKNKLLPFFRINMTVMISVRNEVFHFSSSSSLVKFESFIITGRRLFFLMSSVVPLVYPQHSLPGDRPTVKRLLLVYLAQFELL